MKAPRTIGGPSRARGAGSLLSLICASFLCGVPSSAAAAERVTLHSEDGVALTGTWYPPSVRPAPAVILVHMLNRSRRDWESLGHQLAAAGFGALALDLRGHGESGGHAPRAEGADYAPMVLDLKAARRYLAGRAEVEQDRVGLLGSSLGANLAVLAAAGDSSLASLALLSASSDYRGLRIEAALRKVTRPVLLVASDDDPYASRSARELQKAGGGRPEILVLPQAGHGTVMLARDPALAGALVDWFRRTLL